MPHRVTLSCITSGYRQYNHRHLPHLRWRLETLFAALVENQKVMISSAVKAELFGIPHRATWVCIPSGYRA
jgi:hypothetical protein